MAVAKLLKVLVKLLGELRVYYIPLRGSRGSALNRALRSAKSFASLFEGGGSRSETEGVYKQPGIAKLPQSATPTAPSMREPFFFTLQTFNWSYFVVIFNLKPFCKYYIPPRPLSQAPLRFATFLCPRQGICSKTASSQTAPLSCPAPKCRWYSSATNESKA